MNTQRFLSQVLSNQNEIEEMSAPYKTTNQFYEVEFAHNS